MKTQEEFIRDVLASLGDLHGHSSLQLTSVAKAIEQNNPRISKIIFHEMPDKGLDENGPAIMCSQELELTGMDNMDMLFFEHYIFYENYLDEMGNLDEMGTRFAIAHELGHVFLHNPMDKPLNKRYSAPVDGAERLFTVEYEPEEEIEADIFAFIMCEQREIISRKPEFMEPCRKRLVNFVRKKTMGDESQQLFNEITTCLGCNVH